MTSSWILRGALLGGSLLPIGVALAQPAPSGASAAATSVSGAGAAAPPASAPASAAAASPTPAPACQTVEDLCPANPKKKCVLLRCSLPFGPSGQPAAPLPAASGASSASGGTGKAPEPPAPFAAPTSGGGATPLLPAARGATRPPFPPIAGFLQGEEDRSDPLAFLRRPMTAALPSLDKKASPADATGQPALGDRLAALLETASRGTGREKPTGKSKLGVSSSDSILHTTPKDLIHVSDDIVSDAEKPPVNGALLQLADAGDKSLAGAGPKQGDMPAKCRGDTSLDLLCVALYLRLGRLGLELTPSGPYMEQKSGKYQILLPARKATALAKGSEPLELTVGVHILPGYLIHYTGCPDAKYNGPQKEEYKKVMGQLETPVRDLLIAWNKLLYAAPAPGK